MKTFTQNELKDPSNNGPIGTYIWSVRGHHVIIHLDTLNRFKYEFSNSGLRGYRVGSYSFSKNLVTLQSDSIIQEQLIDILNRDKVVYRSLDTTRFEFMLSEKGLHDKNSDGDYEQKPTYIKE